MHRRWKILLSLALVLPLGAFLAGSLFASAADVPAPRTTIVIRDPSPSSAPSNAPDARPISGPSPGPSSAPPLASDGRGTGSSDDGVEDIRPQTDDLSTPETPESGDDRGGRNDDDHSGHGRGGDDPVDRAGHPTDDHGSSGGSSGSGSGGRG